MANDGNRIYGTINVRKDLNVVLGIDTPSLTDCCTSEKINPFAECKPHREENNPFGWGVANKDGINTLQYLMIVPGMNPVKAGHFSGYVHNTRGIEFTAPEIVKTNGSDITINLVYGIPNRVLAAIKRELPDDDKNWLVLSYALYESFDPSVNQQLTAARLHTVSADYQQIPVVLKNTPQFDDEQEDRYIYVSIARERDSLPGDSMILDFQFVLQAEEYYKRKITLKGTLPAPPPVTQLRVTMTPTIQQAGGYVRTPAFYETNPDGTVNVKITQIYLPSQFIPYTRLMTSTGKQIDIMDGRHGFSPYVYERCPKWGSEVDLIISEQ